LNSHVYIYIYIYIYMKSNKYEIKNYLEENRLKFQNNSNAKTYLSSKFSHYEI
jgi:hypothetical protein